MRILIADDDRASRLVLGDMLTHVGHEVVATTGGQEAWEALGREYFPVLISDWLMPDLDGLDLCRRIRAERRVKYTYIILLTILGGKGHYLEGMAAGADDFLTKPFDPDELSARLRVAERVLGLQGEVTQLRGLLPICAYCKDIRCDSGDWVRIEQYVATRTAASFSHTICPRCYPMQVDLLQRGRRAEP